MHRHNTKTHRIARGFTLAEMLVVVSILGILGALALPSFKSLSERQKAGLVADKLYHHLSFARTEAITRNLPTTLCATKDGKTCNNKKDWSQTDIVIFHDYNGNGLMEAEDRIVKTLNLGLEAHSLTWSSFRNKPYLQWQPGGMTFFQNGNFTYCPASRDARHAKRLILNAAGRVYFALDRNRDGIPEGSDGKNITC